MLSWDSFDYLNAQAIWFLRAKPEGPSSLFHIQQLSSSPRKSGPVLLHTHGRLGCSNRESLQVQLGEDFGIKGIQLWALLLPSLKQSEWWPLRTLKERLLCMGGGHSPSLEGSMMQGSMWAWGSQTWVQIPHCPVRAVWTGELSQTYRLSSYQ